MVVPWKPRLPESVLQAYNQLPTVKAILVAKFVDMDRPISELCGRRLTACLLDSGANAVSN
jgi:hypothetical protein